MFSTLPVSVVAQVPPPLIEEQIARDTARVQAGKATLAETKAAAKVADKAAADAAATYKRGVAEHAAATPDGVVVARAGAATATGS